MNTEALQNPAEGRTRMERRVTLTRKQSLNRTVALLRFEGDTSPIRAPGQFVMLSLPGRFLNRPFSVCDWDGSGFTLIVERVGGGTEQLHEMKPGTGLNALLGLGNGFCPEPASDGRSLLVGGGTGLSPLVGLARRLREAGENPLVLLGFKDASEAFGTELFPESEVRITEDLFGVLPGIPHSRTYACGSHAFMKELARHDSAPGQMAFDVRMGCGVGACMCCSIHTPSGMKRVCHDGPVFRKEDLLWEG